MASTIVQTEFTGSQRAVGIATPLRQDARSRGIFAMNSSVEAQIADNLRNLILTNHGERLMLTGFGADLRDVLSELVSGDDFEPRIMAQIKDTVGKWMPAVVLRDFSTKIDRFNNSHLATIVVTISYDIPVAGAFGKQLEVAVGAM